MTRELIAQAEALSSVIDSVENCPILYSDTIRSRRVNRDDLWAITTEQLLYLRQLVRLFRAQAEQPAEQGEPVAWERCAQEPDFSDFNKWQSLPSDDHYIYHRGPDMQWVRLAKPAGCFFPDGVQSVAHPDPRLAALESLLRALDSLTNPDENFDSAINPGPERDELLAAYTACKDVPR